MKYKCVFIIPYFGKLNNYFQLFLDSCGKNEEYNWLIFTDDMTKYDYPSNIRVIYTSFEHIKGHIQKFYNFDISLEEPYKLCDYRIAYGEIFSEYLKDADFWGYCDTDMIWGKIGNFIPECIYEKNERILKRGHFTLWKNSEKINTLYRKKYKELPIDYKYAFTTRYCCHFDEFEFWDDALEKRKISTWSKVIYADLDCECYDFYLAGKKDNKRYVFQWNDGILKSFIYEKKKILVDEWCYVHLQKRKMDNQTLHNKKYFTIVPNQFISDVLREDTLRMYNKKDIIHKIYLHRRIKRLREIINNVKKGALLYRFKKIKLKIKEL